MVISFAFAGAEIADAAIAAKPLPRSVRRVVGMAAFVMSQTWTIAPKVIMLFLGDCLSLLD